MTANKQPKAKAKAKPKNKVKSQSPAKVHDVGYKKLFSNLTIFRQLLETFIDQAWVKEIDFSDCETVDKSFISDHYKETESDLLYKLKVRGKTIYIYILLEFQSTVPRFMAVRVLNYLTSFYLDLIAESSDLANLKLPAVFPVVLYNGEDRWTAPVEIHDLIENTPDLGDFGLHFKYLLLNESAYSKDVLLQIRNIVSTLFLAEAHYDIELLRQELMNLYDTEADKQAVSLLLNWFRQLAEHGRVSSDDYAKLDYVYKNRQEVQTMLTATLKREREQILKREREQILAEGQTKGEWATLQRTIKQLLEFRFPFSKTEQESLTERLTHIEDTTHLQNLLNELLRWESSLADFSTKLTSYLPANQLKP